MSVWLSFTLGAVAGLVLGTIMMARSIRDDDPKARLIGSALIGTSLGYFSLWLLGVIPSLA